VNLNAKVFQEKDDIIPDADNSEEDCTVVYDDEIVTPNWSHENLPTVNICANWSSCLKKCRNVAQTTENKKNYARKFRARIEPGENEAAENELKSQINQRTFSEVRLKSNF